MLRRLVLVSIAIDILLKELSIPPHDVEWRFILYYRFRLLSALIFGADLVLSYPPQLVRGGKAANHHQKQTECWCLVRSQKQ